MTDQDDLRRWNRERMRERLNGQCQSEGMEALILDLVGLRFGTCGRGYLETRFRLARLAQDAIGITPQSGQARAPEGDPA